MAHIYDQPKGQAYSSFSIVDKEILRALEVFTEELDLKIELAEMQRFLVRDKKRRSLSIIQKDIALHICSFMPLYDTVFLLVSCKKFASYITNIWRIYERMFFSGSTLSASGETPESVKKNIAIEFFNSTVNRNLGFDNIIKDHILVPEQKITILEQRNLQLYDTDHDNLTNIPKAMLEYKENCATIASCNKQICSIIYGEADDYMLEYLEMFRWLCPDGQFSSMPVVDDRLYTGIREKEQIEDNRNRIRRQNGWDSDDPEDGSWAD
jgi:hypothetical protein